MVLRVINPNDFPLKIRGIACDLEINDQHFGSGVTADAATIPPFETRTLPIVVYASVIDLFRGFLTLPGKERLSYRISGSVRIIAGALPTSVPFDTEGKIDLLPLAQAASLRSRPGPG